MSTKDEKLGETTGVGARVGHVARTAMNVVEYIRFGGLETGEEASPYDIAARTPVLTLRHYFAQETGETGERTPILLVPPLMLSADVWDVSPSASAVAHLRRSGLDPWVVDFGDPAQEPGGKARNVTDHVLAVSDAIARVAASTGHPVHIGGYSQGGLFCYQAAALRECRDVASIFALGSPMEPLSLPGIDLPEELMQALTRATIDILSRTGLPGWASANLFSWTSPVATAKGRLQYLLALRDRDALLPRERQRKFLAGDGWITFPGPAIAEVMESMTNERFVRGGLVFDGRTVSLADITCPVLIFTGQLDEFAPPRAVRDVVRGMPRAQVWEFSMPTGHFGLGVGGRANRQTWPTVARWTEWVDAGAASADGPPEGVQDAREVGVEDRAEQPPSALRQVVNVATAAAVAAPGIAKTIVDRVAGTIAEVTTDTVEQVPRLLRLERVGATTQVSYGKLVAEACADDPEAVALLYGGHAFTRADITREVDDLVLRLLAVGVRRGEHVGVLCNSGSALLSTAAALSRIGAVVVLLRPGGDTATELRLGRARRVVVDQAHAGEIDGSAVTVHLLGSGTNGGPNHLGAIATEEVRVPSWYRPDPGRGRDLAFILFSDGSDGIRPLPVTNRRWALSAYGAASTASLTAADTVYSANPLYHPSGLLLATAAPVASGARLALTDIFDPDTFWADVRRYGATVVPYTWSMLSLLLARPVEADERHHPVRLFIGSGMPPAVWRGVLDRFRPAVVVEMFAAARTDAILANVIGRKVGSVGRPLPGTAAIELAAVHPVTGALLHDSDGYVLRARRGRPGRLLVAVDREQPAWEDAPMRGVFGPKDAWIDTGELFVRDADGDLWPRGRHGEEIRTPSGVVWPREVEQILSGVPGVDQAVCIPEGDGAVALVTAAGRMPFDEGRARDALSRRDITDISVAHTPGLRTATADVAVRVVEAIPLTRWYRPDRKFLAAQSS
ncbi:AMP-binding protein [Rhodococcus wratislaviensis]|uniref:AMP-binding protein n=1 Tax=Rhodococcus wratislaviensis TaxID=44752 RepID=UPI003658EEBF